MAKVSIIKEENHVYVDGVVRNVDVSNLPADVHAIQWNGTKGFVEYINDGLSTFKPNVYFSDFTPYQKYVDAWNVATDGTSPPVAPTLLQYAAGKRYQKEVGGIVFQSVPIATDDRSKQMIIGARLAAEANPQFTTPWVGADNAIYDVDAPTIIAISNAVLAHVADCFSIYADLATKIGNNTVTTTAEIDTAFA